MVVYEVNLTLEDAIIGEFRQWLGLHMKDMLGFKGFRRALLMEVDRAETHCLTVWYFVESVNDLNDYFKHGADRMRQEGLARFGGQFRAERRILNLLDELAAD